MTFKPKHFGRGFPPISPGLTGAVHPPAIGPVSRVSLDPRLAHELVTKARDQGLDIGQEISDADWKQYRHQDYKLDGRDPDKHLFEEVLNEVRWRLLHFVGRVKPRNEDCEKPHKRWGSEADLEEVTLFSNTTEALERILWVLRNKISHGRPTLLTTDLEYPSVLACADETWRGPICVVQLSDLFHNWKDDNSDRVAARILRAAHVIRPDVILVSHVDRHFGYCFGWDYDDGTGLVEEHGHPDDLCTRLLLSELSVLQPQPIVVLDGAQAAGNIAVDLSDTEKEDRIPRLWDLVDFYATSGHKWLCGRPTVGIAFAKRGWQIKSEAQSRTGSLEIGGTADLDALRVLANSLVEMATFHQEDGPGLLRTRLCNALTHKQLDVGLEDCWYRCGGFIGFWTGEGGTAAVDDSVRRAVKQLGESNALDSWGRIKSTTWLEELRSPPGSLRYQLYPTGDDGEIDSLRSKFVNLSDTGPLDWTRDEEEKELVYRVSSHWANLEDEDIVDLV